MTNDEIKDIVAEEQQRAAMIDSLTPAARMAIMDMGYYNDALRGYLIEAMKVAGFSRKEIDKALSGLHTVLDDTSAAEATQVYQKF